MCSDITTECLAVRLMENPRGLILGRDELSGWFSSFNAYKGGKGGDASQWLEIHRAHPIVVDRKSHGHDPVYVPRAAVSISGTIQPRILKRVLGNEHLENGMAARFLMAMPPTHKKCWKEAEPEQATLDSFGKAVDRLFSIPYDVDLSPDSCPVRLSFSTNGKESWVCGYNRFASRQASASGDLAAAFAKAEAYAARVALIFHLFGWASESETQVPPTKIDRECVELGWITANWFADEAERIYGILGESEQDSSRRYLVEKIRSLGGIATPRDIQRTTRKFRSSKQIELALEDLVAMDLCLVREKPTTSAGGRPTREFYLCEGHRYGHASTQPTEPTSKLSTQLAMPLPTKVSRQEKFGVNGGCVGFVDAKEVEVLQVAHRLNYWTLGLPRGWSLKDWLSDRAERSAIQGEALPSRGFQVPRVACEGALEEGVS